MTLAERLVDRAEDVVPRERRSVDRAEDVVPRERRSVDSILLDRLSAQVCLCHHFVLNLYCLRV